MIVGTWLQYVRDKRTVVFCASVKHAQQIAELFREQGISAAAVSGGMKQSERREFQDKFVNREIQVLCACDLPNEGWDCPEIEVLFMARPTMSKVLYTQQLGRGMRLYSGKESLMVSGSRICRCCGIPRPWELSRWMRQFGIIYLLKIKQR